LHTRSFQFGLLTLVAKSNMGFNDRSCAESGHS